ncbi:MAG: symmetrical bis(5'-nucleosyl)-tetraphosphatase [Gammaproteobacteria bacterium]|nr:symmetrical bis(5'-nucleosyl)-tetraphosphatase [Gammaproteobacteria bacterium]
MAVYAIGDVQGCHDDLQRLLDHIGFNSDDKLWFCGDLVNRGPHSAPVLRFVRDLGARAITVLGNHDLHLLAMAEGHSQHYPKDTLDNVLDAPDRDDLLFWLRQQPLLHHDAELGYTLIHAGLPPQWDMPLAQQCARELEAVLRSPDYRDYFKHMYGNQPDCWSSELGGIERLRFITNCFTRLRYCDADGRLHLKDKGAPGNQAPGVLPWFNVAGRKTRTERILFGHWSTLDIGEHSNAFALDGGCIWGGKLVALHIDVSPPQWHTIDCVGVRQPGKE